MALVPSRVPGSGHTLPFLANEPDPVPGDYAGGIVRRAVVHNDDLVPPVGLCEHALDRLAHKAGLIVAGDDHGDEVCATLKQSGHSRAHGHRTRRWTSESCPAPMRASIFLRQTTEVNGPLHEVHLSDRTAI